MSEFDVIARYFTRPERALPASVLLGVGDDCALLLGEASAQAISTDLLLEGRHFFAGAEPQALGHKALAVNLSDLAAMGARPVGFTLALALPEIDHDWLQKFSAGLFALADLFNCALVGGDTTKGPLAICITVFGVVDPSRALRRDAARVGDELWVSGSLGEARLALAHRRGELELDDNTLALAALRMDQPQPRIVLGSKLTGIAHAAIDISDGLCGDLGHILDRSRVGATLLVDTLPAGASLSTQPLARRRDFCLTGGDDYELCFTAAPAQHDAVLLAAEAAQTPVTLIGRIEATRRLRLVDHAGLELPLSRDSFDHFKTP